MQWIPPLASDTPLILWNEAASAVTGAAEMQTERHVLRREVGGVNVGVDVGTGM